MKKSIILFALGVASFGGFLPSCTEKAGDKGEMKAPVEVKKETAKKANVETQDPVALNIQNMHDAYKGETTAHAKYAAYSTKAAEEGHP